MDHLLMCPPTHYDLRYEINPWMSLEDKPDISLARKQWDDLYKRLVNLAEVELIEPAPECPDMVFTANAGMVADKRQVLLSRFRHPERRPEEPYFRVWFETHGYRVEEIPDGCAFEGEGDVLPIGDQWLAGYRKRSEICSHREVAELTRCEVLSLELVDDLWYHLDTALFVLDSHTVVYYPGAFDNYAKRVLENNFDTLHVVEEEAMNFCCNSIVIGQTVLMPDGCPLLMQLLERRRYCPVPIPMSEFIKSGGACKCLVLCLERG